MSDASRAEQTAHWAEIAKRWGIRHGRPTIAMSVFHQQLPPLEYRNTTEFQRCVSLTREVLERLEQR